MTVLVHAPSFERRGLTSLGYLLARCQPREVWLVKLPGERYLTAEQAMLSHAQWAETQKLLDEAGAVSKVVFLGEDGGGAHQLAGLPLDSVVNLTTLPKSCVIACAGQLSIRGDISYYYQPLADYIPPTEAQLDSGVAAVVSVIGFEGRPKLVAPNYPFLLLGYEGQRALHFAERVFTDEGRITAVIALPNWKSPSTANHHELTPDAERLRDSLRTLNRHVLERGNVREVCTESLDAGIFADQLGNYIAETLRDLGPGNVVLVPLGTKVQALGCVALAHRFSDVQVLYALPNYRPTIEGADAPGAFYSLQDGGRTIRRRSWGSE